MAKVIPGPHSKLIANQLLFDGPYGFAEKHILDILETFAEYELKKHTEAVVDIL